MAAEQKRPILTGSFWESRFRQKTACSREQPPDKAPAEINQMKADMKLEIIAALKREPEHAESLMTLLAITHRLERIGDHACNIAEDVIYMVEGRDVRHTGVVESGIEESD